MEETTTINKLAKDLKLGTRAINELLQKAKDNNVPCFLKIGKRCRIFKNLFLDFIKSESLKEIKNKKCQKKEKIYIREAGYTGLPTTKTAQESINQLNAIIYSKQ